jgi:hypothetical protein
MVQKNSNFFMFGKNDFLQRFDNKLLEQLLTEVDLRKPVKIPKSCIFYGWYVVFLSPLAMPVDRQAGCGCPVL